MAWPENCLPLLRKVAQGQSMIPVLKSEQAADFIVAGVEKDAREVIEPRRCALC